MRKMSPKVTKDQHEYWFIFQNNQLLLMKNKMHKFPVGFSLSQLKTHFQRQHHLGMFNSINCYCAEIANETNLPSHIEPVSLRKAFEILGMDWYRAATKAYSVINWDKNHQFCGRCGSKTVHKPGTFERTCPHCNLALYPRISPSIIVLIKKGEQLLLARSPHFPAGIYGLIAGFVEVGENIEDAVHREVREEVGMTVTNLHYFGSQSWPFPDSLMIGFIADYASGEMKIDYTEIEAAGWYRFDALPGRPSSISIAGKLIDYFIAEQSKK